jgi:hypothetical protein
MWVILGYALCTVARILGLEELYTASRHSYRSGRPGLFFEYWCSMN